ncbi:MAG: hypothetical protein LQ342_003065 [Letrouitia transgressa]|nr:MAG: hypothetical protein LQ342_003065 [Letrouitia transgressa]
MSPTFATPPPTTSFARIAFPTPHILLVTLNRPESLNCIPSAGHRELDSIWSWLDAEPSLRVGVITGEGRAFCAGADLKEWSAGAGTSAPSSGFGGLSRRKGKKPIIAAVNGLCMGGGCEMAINADLIVASSGAIFALPEVKVGVVALAGALPRLVRTVGKQRAMEMALTGRNVSAQEAEAWGLVNRVVEGGSDAVVKEALRLANLVCGNSPDSVLVSKYGVDLGWEGIGVGEGTQRILVEGWTRMEGKENMKEGLTSFVGKRKPRWVDSKL